MEPEIHPCSPQPSGHKPGFEEFSGLRRIFIGKLGLRSGWSVLIAVILYRLLIQILGTAAVSLYPPIAKFDFSPTSAIVGELLPLLAAVAVVAIMARIEQRRIVDYNLTGPRRFVHFFSGMAVGFAALTALVGAMAWGGWLHFGPMALSGAQIFSFGALWAVAFLLTGFFEEGSFRCYLQFTFTRGINFWWALGIVGTVCLKLLLTAKGNDAWGVYGFALLGLFPCLILQVRKTPRSGFWQAAWVTSTLFGFIHTRNGGENWIGIFAVALIGFVFCVSVRLTGSAWWAIGCHAAWDWAETYFYGTADSGMVAQGHFLTTTLAGNVLWSGGTDGPEGSLLVIGIILLLLAALVVIYGHGKTTAMNASQEPSGDG